MGNPDVPFSNVIQIGIVVSDINKAIEGYRDLLHIEKWNINHGSLQWP